MTFTTWRHISVTQKLSCSIIQYIWHHHCVVIITSSLSPSSKSSPLCHLICNCCLLATSGSLSISNLYFFRKACYLLYWGREHLYIIPTQLLINNYDVCLTIDDGADILTMDHGEPSTLTYTYVSSELVVWVCKHKDQIYSRMPCVYPACYIVSWDTTLFQFTSQI